MDSIRYRLYSTVVLIILTVFANGLLAQIHFTQVTDQPVFSYGASGKWDAGAVWYPDVIQDGDTLRMWYTGLEASVWDANLPKIGYAWSLDGVEWHRYAGNPVLFGEFPWEVGKVTGCAVIKDDAIFKMWYGAGGYPARRIGYATSTNGINWSKHPEPVLLQGQWPAWDHDITAPHTVIKEDGSYKMWYSGGSAGSPGSSKQTGFATSTDGINWVKYNDPSTTETPFSNSDPVVKSGVSGEWDEIRAWTPMVLPTDTGYEMWYSGLEPPISTASEQWVGYATSTDGISWTKWSGNPILKTNPVWGFSYYGATVLKFNGKYHFWYACFHTSPTQAKPQIGYATSIVVTDVESAENERAIPTQYSLFQNFPNPFNPATRISHEISQRSRVVLKVVNLLGQEVRTLVNEEKLAGSYEVTWDGRDNHGQRVATGVYLYKLETKGFVQTRKMVLLQ